VLRRGVCAAICRRLVLRKVQAAAGRRVDYAKGFEKVNWRNYMGTRTDMVKQLQDYLNHGKTPCRFLIAVLGNDLRGACSAADDDNRQNLFDVVSYCYNHLPARCWGSPERVETWIAGGWHCR